MKGKLGRKLMAISMMLTAVTAEPDFAARDLLQHRRGGDMAVGASRPVWRREPPRPRNGRQQQPRMRRPVGPAPRQQQPQPERRFQGFEENESRPVARQQQERFQGFEENESNGFPGNFPKPSYGFEERPVYQYKKPQDGATYDDNGNRIRRRGYNQRPQQQQPQHQYREEPVDTPRKRVFVDVERQAIIEDEEPIELSVADELLETAPTEEFYYKPASGPAYKPDEASPRADFGDYGGDNVPPMPDFGAPLQVGAQDRSGGLDGQHDIQSAVFAAANAYKPDGVYQTEDRLDFQIHGHEGPHSYRYGYDTGHGYNRQFRYEERDGKGYVKGRYGFFDKYGKLQVTNYSADPYKGFHAEGAHVPKYPH